MVDPEEISITELYRLVCEYSTQYFCYQIIYWCFDGSFLLLNQKYFFWSNKLAFHNVMSFTMRKEVFFWTVMSSLHLYEMLWYQIWVCTCSFYMLLVKSFVFWYIIKIMTVNMNLVINKSLWDSFSLELYLAHESC